MSVPRVPIGELVTIHKGRKPNAVLLSPAHGAVRLLQIRDLRGDIAPLYTTDANGTRAVVDNLLIAWDGANAGTVGYGLDGYVGSTLAVLRLVSNRVLPAYIGRFLQSRFAVLNGSTDGAAVPHVNRRLLESLVIPLPPFAEQRRIAEKLDKVDAIRRKRQESFRLLEEFLRSAFMEMFGDPVRNEKQWRRLTIGELLPEKQLIVDGPFGSSLKPDSYVDSGVRVVRNFNIEDDSFDSSAFKYVTEEKFEQVKRSEVKPGDLLISTKGTLGNVCLMPDLSGRSVLSATGTVRVRLPDEITIRRQFVVAQMVTAPYKQYLRRFEAGSNQKYLNLAAIRKFAVILPPIVLQDRFCELRNRVTAVRLVQAAALGECEDLYTSTARLAFG